MGRVTSFSDSSAASAETSVFTCTCTPVMSGTASMGKWNAAHRPAPSKPNAASSTSARWRSANSSMPSVIYGHAYEREIWPPLALRPWFSTMRGTRPSGSVR